MTDLMRKILYYENILEFKEKTRSALQTNEVDYWNLCRTCLSDAEPTGSAELGDGGSGVCVIGLDGQLMHAKDMLSAATSIEILHADRLPMKMCKECLTKLTTLYFFRLQTRRAETVLRRILQKLDESQAVVEKLLKPTTSTKHCIDITVNEADCSSTRDTIEAENKPAVARQEAGVESEPELRLSPKLEQLEHENHHLAIDDHEDENAELLEINELIYEDEEQLEECIANEEEYILEEINETSTQNVEIYDLEDIEPKEIYADEDGDEDETEVVTENELQKFADTEATCMQPQRKRCKGGKTLLDNLVCVICNKTFPLQRMLIAHVHAVHPNSKAFKCRHCTQMFSHLQSLSRHMQIHQPTKYNKVCSICKKSFLRADDWRRHLRTHTGERPYVCNICRKGFKQACELKEHTNTHLKHRRFVCSICGHCLQSRNGLYIHKKVHEGIKQHKCIQCEKRFITRGELKSHMNVHSKPKH